MKRFYPNGAPLAVLLLLILRLLSTADDWKILPKSKPKEVPSIIETPPHKSRAGVEEDRPKVSLEYLGKELFNDPILSAGGKVSCATCHVESHGFASNGLPPKLGGGVLSRKGPSLYDHAKATVLMWDGRFTTLEEQIEGPLFNPDEMGNKNWEEIMDRLKGTAYEHAFKDVSPLGFHPATVIRCIVAYERTIEHPNRKWDSYVEGRGEMTPAQKRGYDLFRGEAHCYKCHTGRLLTDDKFHNTGLAVRTPDLGRFRVTQDERDKGAFKTPGLRGVKDTAPYMHDGSIDSLEKVIEFYDRGGDGRRGVGILDKEIKPLRLSPRQKSDLLEFLKVL